MLLERINKGEIKQDITINKLGKIELQEIMVNIVIIEPKINES